MTSIVHLPYELLALVTADIVNFALACKRLYSAAEAPLLAHLSRMREYYEYVSVGNNHHFDAEMYYLPRLLKTVIRNQSLSFSIRHLSLRGLACGWEEKLRSKVAFQPESIFRLCPPADLEPILELARGVNNGFDEDEEDFKRSGVEAVIAALLILRLPYLSSLTWQADGSGANFFFFDIIERMVQDPKLNPLAKVKTVKLQQNVDSWRGKTMSVKSLACFMALPSVQNVHASSIGCLTMTPENAFGVRESNVSDLTLSYEDLEPKLIERIIAYPRALRKFTYFWPFSSAINGPASGPAIIDILVAHASDSLESLTLRSGSWSSVFRLEQLWRLPNLRFLNTNLCLLLSDDDRWTVRSTLPKPLPSMKHIQLYQEDLVCPADALKSLLIVIDAKTDIIPKLSMLEVCLEDKQYEEEMDYILSLSLDVSRSCRKNMVVYDMYLCELASERK